MDSLQKTADYVADALRRTPGIIQLKFSSSLGNPETKVEIDRQKMASFGLTVNDVGTILGIALTGNDDSKYREGSNEYPIRIQLDEFDRTNPDDLAHLTFFGANSKAIELQQFAKIYQGVGPTKLERKDKNSLTSVFAYTDGSPSGSVLASFNQILKDKRAEGTKIGFGGDQKK
jgi:HAE1 family hydrophobic/amphiphilic exporter-1